jgi:hypothetical protein
MKVMRASVLKGLLAVSLAGLAAGCLSIKTEHEIKPIHITMDVNLKVQKDLEEFLNLD